MAPQLAQTRLVYIADREADIMALMVRARDLSTPVDWLVRSQHNRALGQGEKLWPQVKQTPALGAITFTMITFTMPSRQGKKARQVTPQIWATTVALPDGHRGAVTARCIVACETAPLAWRARCQVATAHEFAGEHAGAKRAKY
jgi:hypothetical protein